MSSKCPTCEKPVYFAERIQSMGKDWHSACLKCKKCSKKLIPGQHLEHDGSPYCEIPCYKALFGPKGYNQAAGVNSYTYN